MTSMTPEEVNRRQQARQADLDSWRANNPDSEPLPSPEAVLSDQAANRSRLDPPFASAFSLLNAGYQVVVCNASGKPFADAQPISDVARLMTAWDKHPSGVAAAACGSAYGLVAARVNDAGQAWLAEVSIDPATRQRPPGAPPAKTDLPFGGYEEVADPRPGPQRRELFATVINLVEVLAAPPRMASATTSPGSRATLWGQDLAAKLARPKPAVSIIYAWSWPLAEGGKTWTLGRGRAGVELLAAIPADGQAPRHRRATLAL